MSLRLLAGTHELSSGPKRPSSGPTRRREGGMAPGNFSPNTRDSWTASEQGTAGTSARGGVDR